MREDFDVATLSGKTAVVVGAGLSGQAASRLLASRGARAVLLEKNPAALTAERLSLLAEAGVVVSLGEHAAKDFAGADLIVPSPGVPPSVLAPHVPETAAVMSELELAYRLLPTPGPKIAAITGTNGKTTTTMLTAEILAASGRDVFIGGNIGAPLADHVLSGNTADVLVLEVSSFQLQLCSTFRPEAAALLNFSANHLDYHADMEEYLAAKLKLFAAQTEDDLAVLPLELKDMLAPRLPGKARRLYVSPKGRFTAPNLPGEHNQANMEAAAALCAHFGVAETVSAKVMAAFVPARHRLERVGEKAGVLFIDDSKATTVEAMRAALRSMDRPVRLLAGGMFKGGDLASLGPDLKKHVVGVGLFGASREIFEKAFNGLGGVFWEPDLDAATRRHFAAAQPGEVILLSPGTSSFDLYPDYKARGNHFQRIFAALPEKKPGERA